MGDDSDKRSQLFTFWPMVLFAFVGVILAIILLWPRGVSKEAALADLDKKANYAFTVGDLEGARTLCEKLLQKTEQDFGPAHPNMVNALNNLALVLQAQGNNTRAVALLERALSINEAVLGEKNPNIVLSLTNLALAYEAEGNDEKATELYNRALAMAELSLPPDHPHLASLRENLARLKTAPIPAPVSGAPDN